MARVPHPDKLTPADELRSLLAECEQALGQVKGSADDARAILGALDRMHDLLPGLEARGMDLRPEKTRIANVESQLQGRAGEFLRALRSVGGLAEARGAMPRDPSRWWWYLDEQVRRRRGKSAKRMLLAGVGVAALLLVLAVLYQRFLAPDPLTARGLELQSLGESLAMSGDYSGALRQLDQAQELLPEDGDLYVWRGVLRMLVGEPGRAEELLATAAPLFEDNIAYLLARGQAFLQLQELARAAADAEQVLDEDPGSPEGYLLRGSVLEAMGSTAEAIESYQAASRYADERGKAELSAVARFRMGMLSQLGVFQQSAQ